MSYQIDQSGKIEQTNKNTVLCLSNGTWDAVTIKSKTKRELQEIFRQNGQPQNFVLFVFCAGLSLLLKRNDSTRAVIIDREYFGREPIIKKILLKMLDGQKIDINFASIGRKAQAHSRGYLVFTGKLLTKKVLKLKEVLEEIKKTEVTLS